MYDLEAIRNAISLPALAEEAGAEFDSRLRSRCPLPKHAGDRSSRAFTIFDNGRRWKCHSSCPSDANGGDVFSFYMAWKGVDFKTAVSELAERARVAPAAQVAAPRREPIQAAPVAPGPAWRARAGQFVAWAEANLQTSPAAQRYLEKERGLSPETWRAFRLGYNPTRLYDDPARWGLTGKKIWLPRGIVIPGLYRGEPWYVKIRRPRPGDALEHALGIQARRSGPKFGGPRGGAACLFRLELLDYLPVLVLTEGEWDAMLLWEYCPDLCDVGTLGGAAAKLDALDLSLLTRYPVVLVVHDNDQAGEMGRKYIAELHARFPRVQPIQPPAHDLTDFWKSGGDVRAWLAGQVAGALEHALRSIQSPQAPAFERWQAIVELAKSEARNG